MWNYKHDEEKKIWGFEKMESKREQNKRQCREKILKASVKLFGTKGFEETLISDVAKKAKVSRATLYNYFPSKESLLMGIANQEMERLQKAMRTTYARESAEQKLRHVLGAFVCGTFSYVSISRRLFLMNAQKDSFVFSTRDQLFDLFSQLIQQGKQEGYFRGDVPDSVIAELLHATILETQFGWLDVQGMSQEECDKKLDDLLNRMLASAVCDAPDVSSCAG